MILNRCRCAFVFPCPVTIAVKFCVRFNFIFSFSHTFGKYSFVVLPLVVCVQFLCHFLTLSSSNSLVTTLFGILLYSSFNDSFFADFFASVSANSFPIIRACALTQQRFTYIYRTKMADETSLQLGSALSKLLSITEKNGNLRKDFKRDIVDSVSTLRNIFVNLKAV